ncbi:MAG TPA: hypothetical protein VFB29_04820 [Pseudolabrys sp.]|nr:hypothetical protein [Pseudolabrys sp.]
MTQLDADYATDSAPISRRNAQSRLRSLDDLDGRTKAARRAQALVAQIEADLGGTDQLSTAQRELIRSAALLGAMTEDQAARWLERKPADLTLFGTLVDRQRRILETLGLSRKARDVTGQIIERINRGDI